MKEERAFVTRQGGRPRTITDFLAHKEPLPTAAPAEPAYKGILRFARYAVRRFLALSLTGFSLDRIFNPRLRDV